MRVDRSSLLPGFFPSCSVDSLMLLDDIVTLKNVESVATLTIEANQFDSSPLISQSKESISGTKTKNKRKDTRLMIEVRSIRSTVYMYGAVHKITLESTKIDPPAPPACPKQLPARSCALTLNTLK